jgi:hypothetical protein
VKRLPDVSFSVLFDLVLSRLDVLCLYLDCLVNNVHPFLMNGTLKGILWHVSVANQFLEQLRARRKKPSLISGRVDFSPG